MALAAGPSRATFFVEHPRRAPAAHIYWTVSSFCTRESPLESWFAERWLFRPWSGEVFTARPLPATSPAACISVSSIWQHWYITARLRAKSHAVTGLAFNVHTFRSTQFGLAASSRPHPRAARQAYSPTVGASKNGISIAECRKANEPNS